MVVSQDSPKHRRRQSIAVPNVPKLHNPSKGRRRAHSIAPGDLSPFTKARRSLVPRKSILKIFTNTYNNGDDLPDSQPQSSQVFLDEEGTQSMDLTQEYQRDYTSRKSLGGRRVSFAADVKVRLIDGKKKESSSSSQPSPEEPSQHSRGPIDENAYPGVSSSRRRRSSIRYSLASEDMDMTTVIPSNFAIADDSALMEGEFDPAEEDGMDMTEVLHADIIRRRTLSSGSNRTPLAQLPQTSEQAIVDVSQSFEEETSHTVSSIASDRSSVMEFTMPLNSSLRPPPQQDEAWLALRQATHSGDTPVEPEYTSDDYEYANHHETAHDDSNAMELDDAVERLIRARNSLPGSQTSQAPDLETVEEDSLISSEMSFDDGNETVNVSKAYGFVASTPRPSMGTGYDSTMDESEIYGKIVAANPPRLSIAAPEPHAQSMPEEVRQSPVFQRPPSNLVSSNDQRPTRTPPPQNSPEPPDTLPPSNQDSTPPLKRPRTPGDDGSQLEIADQPSPAKRPNVWERLSAPSPRALRSPKMAPKPLSPGKRAPFQRTGPESSATYTSSLRRPSDYFARRKSLGPNLRRLSAPASPNKASPKKLSVETGRRASVAATLGGNHGALNVQFALPTRSKALEPGCEREVSLQAVASPTVTRGSPAPTSPRPSALAPRSQEVQHTDVPVSVPSVDDSMFRVHGDPERSDALAATEKWRNAIEDVDLDNEDADVSNVDISVDKVSSAAGQPAISIQQFFMMTGIKFMDEIGAPRRSMHPLSQPSHQFRPMEEIPLADYTIAMGLDIPQLVLHGQVSKDFQAWIEKSKADLIQAEEEAAKSTPQLFAEYARADEEGQAELLHQLKLIRTNTRALAKSGWYNWKLQWLEGLQTTAEEAFKSLEEDAIFINEALKQAEDIIPFLEEEYEDLLKELEQERKEVAEIEAGDQEYLNELKASIAEQNIEVEALRAELAESKAQLYHLEGRRVEAEAQKQEAITAIANGQKLLHVQKNSTRAEVFRLKDELEALEDLHMVRITKVDPELFEYVYASRFVVSIPCKSYQPDVQRTDIRRVDKTRSKCKDRFARLSDLFLRIAKEQIVRSDLTTTRQVVQRLSDYWSSCAQIRSQLKLLSVKYPVDIEIHPNSPETLPGFTAKALVLFPTLKAKAVVSFIFNSETLCFWPVSIADLRCDAEVVYGNVDRQSILNAVLSRLEEATPAENYGCLLDSCIECQEIYH